MDIITTISKCYYWYLLLFIEQLHLWACLQANNKGFSQENTAELPTAKVEFIYERDDTIMKFNIYDTRSFGEVIDEIGRNWNKMSNEEKKEIALLFTNRKDWYYYD